MVGMTTENRISAPPSQPGELEREPRQPCRGGAGSRGASSGRQGPGSQANASS